MSHVGALSAIEALEKVELGDSVHAPQQRFAAVGTCLLLASLAALALPLGARQGPAIAPFLPIAGTVWALADLMTAFLLLARFYVNGTTFFTALAAAYALSGLLTWPYLLEFPGLFRTGSMPLADQQISIWIWVLWHATFPIVVSISALCDPKLKLQTFSRSANLNAVWITLCVTVCVAAALTALTIGSSSALPTIIANGHFKPAFGYLITPSIAALNIAACCLLLRRGRAMTTLQLWLCVAMITATLEVFLNAMSSTRFSYAWYLGKLETVTTACVVLGILLCDVMRLYRRMANLATIDPLTQLDNRRALEAHMRVVLNRAKRQSSGLGLLVVDIDFFKGYNDGYGHANGDECLRRVAALLKSTATRPLDLTARFGGEEFVILMPDTPRAGVIAVAERVLAFVEAAAIPYAGSERGVVTVSAGAAFIADARGVDGDELFEAADRALYEAKAAGRNSSVVTDFERAPHYAAALPGGDEPVFGP